jgi:hypothetical protein
MMQKVLIASITISLVIVGCNKQITSTTDRQHITANATEEKTYGSEFTEENVINGDVLQKAIANQDSVKATVTAEITETCQTKGCWMDVKLPDNTIMKVMMKDHAFFLPLEDHKGKTVIFTGTATREEISVEQLRHFAEDAGKTQEEIKAITAPKTELRFIADGVKVK